MERDFNLNQDNLWVMSAQVVGFYSAMGYYQSGLDGVIHCNTISQMHFLALRMIWSLG